MRALRPSVLLVAGFLAALAAPTLDRVLRPDSARDTRSEGRMPAPWPQWKWSAEALRRLPAALQSHLDDTLGLRDWLLRANTLRGIEIFGHAPSSTISVGRDGWWYYGGEDSLPSYRGLLPFRESELAAWRTALERQRDWLRARGIEFVFAIGPNKETIYPEHLAPEFEQLGPTRLEQLVAYLRANSDLAFLDLRGPLAEEKQHDSGDDLVYYRLGTHWTHRGAWIAAREILRALALAPEPRTEFESQPLETDGDSAAGLLYVPRDYRQEAWAFVPRAGFRAVTLPDTGRPGEVRRERAGAPRRSCLLLHDSFGLGVDKFLAEHFEHFCQRTQTTLEESLVDELQPDVVVELFVERKLLHAPPRLELRQDPLENRLRFASSKETLFLWDGTHPREGFEGLAGARVEAQPAGGVRITTSGPGETFLTPALPFPRDSSCVLALEIESPSAQTLDVFFLREGDTGYERSRSFQLELAAGAQTLYWRFESRDLAGRLRIRPRTSGTLGTRRLELRALRGG